MIHSTNNEAFESVLRDNTTKDGRSFYEIWLKGEPITDKSDQELLIKIALEHGIVVKISKVGTFNFYLH